MFMVWGSTVNVRGPLQYSASMTGFRVHRALVLLVMERVLKRKIYHLSCFCLRQPNELLEKTVELL